MYLLCVPFDSFLFVGRMKFLFFSSIQERIAMSSLQGLPPLPRSLSGFNLSGGRSEGCEPPPPPTRSSSKTQRGGKTSIQSSSRPSPPARQLTTLDTQLAILRREMVVIENFVVSDPYTCSFSSARSFFAGRQELFIKKKQQKRYRSNKDIIARGGWFE